MIYKLCKELEWQPLWEKTSILNKYDAYAEGEIL